MRKVKNKKLSYARYGYYFSIPFAVAFLLFTLYPIVYTVIIGFTDLKGLGMTSFHFLKDDPFRNFKTVLANHRLSRLIQYRGDVGIKLYPADPAGTFADSMVYR